MHIKAQVRSVLMHGEYVFRGRRRDGTIVEGESKNYVGNVGRQLFLNAYFGISSLDQLYMSLVGSVAQNFVTGQYEETHSFTNIDSLSWRELQNYTGGANRKTVGWSTDAATGRIETDFQNFSLVSTPNTPFGDVEAVFLATGQPKTGLTSSASGNDELFSVAAWEHPAVLGTKDGGNVTDLLDLDVKYRIRLFFGGDISGTAFGLGGATISGRNDMLNVAFRGNAPTSQWYLGLVDVTSFSTIRETDTLASHAGWNELPADNIFDTGGDRIALTFAGSATISGQNLSDVVTLTMNTPGTMLGLFLTDQQSGNSGLLHSVVQFTEIFTIGRGFRRYDRFFIQYGLAMDDVSYREKKGVL